MQIPPIPPPVAGNALPQDVVAKAVPNLQAVQPLVQNAVNPTAKTEKFNETRANKDRRRNDRRNDKNKEPDKEDNGEHTVNIRV